MRGDPRVPQRRRPDLGEEPRYPRGPPRVRSGVAVALSLGTFVFLFLHDSWTSDNQFLVPDLILCAGLLVAAAL